MALNTIRRGALEYLTADGIAVPHGFTTRLGGVSEGALASLNLGTRRGDDPARVLENYRILGRAIGFAPENLVLTRQIHSDIVRRVGRAEAGAGLFRPDLEGCDGLITDEPGIGLVAFAADCTPVLLWDPETGAVGAVHAGWRGTANRIAAKAVRAMTDAFGTRPEHLRAAIGPNIGPCCFETDADVPEAILASVGPAAKPWIRVRHGGKFDVDLKSVNRLILEQAGVRHIDVSTDCTACRPDRFWSHRRVGAARGAQGAVIVCRKEEPA